MNEHSDDTIEPTCATSGPPLTEDELEVRQKLPSNLSEWIFAEDAELGAGAGDKFWDEMDGFFRERGLEQWTLQMAGGARMEPPRNELPKPNGYKYARQMRGVDTTGLGSVQYLKRFDFGSSLCRAYRTADGFDVVARVLAIGDDGKKQLNMVRKLGNAPLSFVCENHCLPLLREIQFDDINFGFFPMGYECMRYAYTWWPKNSVGDVLDMFLQALEGLTFIHSLGIAHRDAFKDNFLVQWWPESMLTMKIPVSRPRVYLIDFEFAVQFPDDCPEEDRVCYGTPIERYGRPIPPEIAFEKPYCPFKLDVWQLGASFHNFRSRIPDIDNMIMDLFNPNDGCHLESAVALEKLSSVIHSIEPKALLVHPWVVKSPLEEHVMTYEYTLDPSEC